MKTGIEIQTGFFPLAWFLHFVKPVIEINGKKHTEEWGPSFFDLPPGKYEVKIYFPYMWRSECGANQISLTLQEGLIKKIEYYMPPWMFAKGSIKEIS